MFCFANCCRYCLNNTNLCDYNLSDSNGIPYYDQINELIPNLKYSSSNIFPKSICEKCIGALTTINTFKETCLKSQNLLSTYSKQLTTVDYNDAGVIDRMILIEHHEIKIEDNLEMNNCQLNLNDNVPSDQFTCTGNESNITNINLNSIKNEPIDYNDDDDDDDGDNDDDDDRGDVDDNDPKNLPFQFVEVKEEDKHLQQDDNNASTSFNCPNGINEQQLLLMPTTAKLKTNKLTCNICGKQIVNQFKLKVHLRTHTGEKPYHCGSCDEKFHSRQRMREHKLKMHTDLKNTVNTEDPSKKRMYTCNYCNKIFQHRSTMQTHKRLHTGIKPFACDVCGKRFSRLGHLNGHRFVHLDEKSFDCKVCDKKFRFAQSLRRHVREHTVEKIPIENIKTEDNTSLLVATESSPHYNCAVCGKIFTDPVTFNSHKCANMTAKMHNCDMCGKKFVDITKLTIHKRTHTGEKPYCCGICGKQFTQSGGLKSHQRMHAGNKPYKCKTCGKRFTYTNLKLHELKHTNKEPFQCKSCDYKTPILQLLVNHERIHTGEKPYSCSICGKSFAQAAHVKRHERTHTAEKPFSCDICGQQFKSQYNMNRHKRRFIDKKSFDCQRCDKKFHVKQDLVQHEMNSHYSDTGKNSSTGENENTVESNQCPELKCEIKIEEDTVI